MLNKAVEWGMLDVNPFKRGAKLLYKEDHGRLRRDQREIARSPLYLRHS